MHIVVFGAGGVGGYFGGRLAASGEKVTFIARGKHLQAMLSAGLTVESSLGNFTIKPVDATDDTSRIVDVDLVLVCVKTWQLPECARAILPMLSPKTTVLPLENGIDAPDQLIQVIGKQHVLGGFCRITSWISSPGQIKQSGIEPSVAFGEMDNHSSPRTKNLLAVFQKSGIRAEIPVDIHVGMWQKFLFISSVSGLGALTRMPLGVFRSQPGTRHILKGTLNECCAVAAEHGISLPPDAAREMLAFIDKLPGETIASMQRDIMDGKPSELESQNGMVVWLGRMYNIPTPNHEFIYHCLLPQEALARRL